MGKLQAGGGRGVLLPSVWALQQDLGLLPKRGGMALRDLRAAGGGSPGELSLLLYSAGSVPQPPGRPWWCVRDLGQLEGLHGSLKMLAPTAPPAQALRSETAGWDRRLLHLYWRLGSAPAFVEQQKKPGSCHNVC